MNIGLHYNPFPFFRKKYFSFRLEEDNHNDEHFEPTIEYLLFPIQTHFPYNFLLFFKNYDFLEVDSAVVVDCQDDNIPIQKNSDGDDNKYLLDLDLLDNHLNFDLFLSHHHRYQFRVDE